MAVLFRIRPPLMVKRLVGKPACVLIYTPPPPLELFPLISPPVIVKEPWTTATPPPLELFLLFPEMVPLARVRLPDFTVAS